jgi:hypothetical protein
VNPEETLNPINDPVNEILSVLAKIAKPAVTNPIHDALANALRRLNRGRPQILDPLDKV